MSADAGIRSQGSTERLRAVLLRLLRPCLGLLLVCAGFSAHPRFLHTFWTRDYLPNILQQAATNIIAAVGMTFVIMTGGIDLSVGSVMALCGVALGLASTGELPGFAAVIAALPLGLATCVAASRGYGLRSPRGAAGVVAGIVATMVGSVALQAWCGSGANLAAGIGIALCVGLGCGLCNGIIITGGRVPPFVATLGMLTAARGLTVYATNGNSVSGLPAGLGALGQGAPLVLIALATVLVGSLVLARTRAGRYVTAIGGNEEASRLTGVDVRLYKTFAYAVSGLTAATAAIVLTAKFRLADTGAGANAELSAIAAVVIGGASLSGGRASVAGSMLGALTIAVLNAGLVLVGIPDTLQGVVIGGVIILTVMVDQLQRRGERA